MRVRVGDVIEPAVLRRAATWPIVNFNFRQYKVSRGINDHTMRYEPKGWCIDLSSTIVK